MCVGVKANENSLGRSDLEKSLNTVKGSKKKEVKRKEKAKNAARERRNQEGEYFEVRSPTSSDHPLIRIPGVGGDAVSLHPTALQPAILPAQDLCDQVMVMILMLMMMMMMLIMNCDQDQCGQPQA